MDAELDMAGDAGYWPCGWLVLVQCGMAGAKWAGFGCRCAIVALRWADGRSVLAAKGAAQARAPLHCA